MGKPIVTLIVFIVAAAALNTWQLVLPNFHFDNSFSVAAAKNVAEGHGYTLKQVLPADVSQIIYDPLNKWPPGYSWLLVGLMKVTGAGVITALYIVNALMVLVFLAGLYCLLSALTFPARHINWFILFAGFFPYAFLGTWFADLAAVACFTLAIALILQAHNTGRHLYARAVAAALLCSYCIFLKYMYLPVAILPVIVWGWYALRNRKRVQVRAALAGAVIVMGAAVALLWYQSVHSGQPVYVNPTGKGFFPGHLLYVGPLVPASIIDQEFLSMQMDRLPFLSYTTAKTAVRIVNYFLLAALCWWIIRCRAVKSLYAYIALIVTLAIAVMLSFLSLTFAPYLTEFTPFWTYVEELRYYAIVIVFIQIWLYFITRKPGIIRFVVIAVALVGTLHSVYYLAKQAVIKREIGLNKKNEQVDIVALREVKQLRMQYPELVVCSNRVELANMMSLSGAPVMYDYDKLNGPLKASRPVMMVAILHNDFIDRFRPFLQTYQPVKVGEHYEFSFYLATIR